jgi:MoCo/4Fe-4S cofactor protein with predicted Tat translocation signal
MTGRHSEESKKNFAAMRERILSQQGKQYWRSLEEFVDAPEFEEFVGREFPQHAETWDDPVSRRSFLKLMGASLALAGLSSACVIQPPEKVIPYVQQPEEIVPGKALFFATAMTLKGIAVGLLAKSNEGRPTKIEGNPQHPGSLGSTDKLAQASLLTMYDPDRSQDFLYRNAPRSWNNFVAEARAALERGRETGGAGIRFLTQTVTSPTLIAQFRQILSEMPNARWYQYEPSNNDNGFAGARMAFGDNVHTVYNFAAADRILSLDSDFLNSFNVRYVRDFSDRRRVTEEKKDMNRLYQVETTLTITGAKADHRKAVKPSNMENFARAAATALGVPNAGGTVSEDEARWIGAMAKDLRENGAGRSIVIAGDHQPPLIHALAHAMNAELGNVGKTLTYHEPIEANAAGQTARTQIEGLRELVRDIDAGAVQLLVMLGGNPMYDTPADLKFTKERMDKVPFRVHLSLYNDETSQYSHWHIPQTHYLEEWSDARAFDGTATLVQPLIAPLYGGKSVHEVLNVFARENYERSGYEIVREFWQRQGLGTGLRPLVATTTGGAAAAATTASAQQQQPRPAASPRAANANANANANSNAGAGNANQDANRNTNSNGNGNSNQSGELLSRGQSVPAPDMETSGRGPTVVDAPNMPGLANDRSELPRARSGSEANVNTTAALSGISPQGFDAAWRKVVHDGFIPGTATQPRNVSPNTGFLGQTAGIQAASGGNALEVNILPDPSVYDGRFANNGWLQELPKPLNKLTWDNVLLLSPRTADRLGLNQGRGKYDNDAGAVEGTSFIASKGGNLYSDLVNLTVNGQKISKPLPVWVQPGQPDDVATIFLGYGRSAAGKVGNGIGYDAYEVVNSNLPAFGVGEIVKTGEQTQLASTQTHFSMEGRDILRVRELEKYKANPDYGHQHDEYPKSMYSHEKYDTQYKTYNRWGMAIDLNACVGCNACVVACQAENNIPVVGKEQVERSREMHWLRIDAYYGGEDQNDPQGPYFQPVLCQQCEQAPCEPVCPVHATVHSAEGLNDMVYNRCVGTRYCSNNCPYKVRRFNFLLYQDWYTPQYKLMRNPEVTVRSRGVMEKCTYCTQRIAWARIEAQKAYANGESDGKVRDGEVQTACQAVCPTEAIIFGNMNDPEAAVNKLKAEHRNYKLLNELNTQPRTTYLAGLKNQNREMPDYKEILEEAAKEGSQKQDRAPVGSESEPGGGAH